MLNKVHEVKAAIEARLRNTESMESDEILRRLSALARSSIGDFLRPTKTGWTVDIEAVKRSQLVRRIRMGRFGADIELFDNVGALVTLAKLRGMFRQEQSDLRKELLEAIVKAERIYQAKYGDLYDEGPPPRPQLDGPPNGDG
jgi:hypothetical protein